MILAALPLYMLAGVTGVFSALMIFSLIYDLFVRNDRKEALRSVQALFVWGLITTALLAGATALRNTGVYP